MTKNTNTVAPLPAVPAESKSSSTNTKLLVMAKAQNRAHELVIGDHTFQRDGEPVEVPAAEADELLERRDEYGAKYVSEA